MYNNNSYLKSHQDPHGRPYTDLMPAQNAIQVAADSVTSVKHALAVNLGFFETDSFTNRPAEGPNWKGIYQEPCTTIAGTYSADGVNFSGKWKDRHWDKGKPDKSLATMAFTPEGILYSEAYDDKVESYIRPGEKVFAGVLIRRLGADISRDSGEWPQFVIDKADSVVGRTAIGFDWGDQVKIVVVQAGNGGTSTVSKGASIETVRNMFKKEDYPYVFLLDGSGSSQMATSLPPSPLPGSKYRRVRTGCITTEVAVCSWWGDTAKNNLVSHYDAQWTPANTESSATDDSWVDRRAPAFLVLSGPK